MEGKEENTEKSFQTLFPIPFFWRFMLHKVDMDLFSLNGFQSRFGCCEQDVSYISHLFDERQNDENGGFNLLNFYMLFLFTWQLKIQQQWCFICAVLVFCSQKAVFIFIFEAADESCLTVMTVCLESIRVWCTVYQIWKQARSNQN